MPTLFKSLAELLEKIESTKKRLQIIDLTADLLRKLEPEEIEPAISMILGRPFPKYSPKTLDVSWTTLSAILQRTASVDWNAFREAFSSTGDIGSATKTVFEKTKMKKQALLVEKAFTIKKSEACWKP